MKNFTGVLNWILLSSILFSTILFSSCSQNGNQLILPDLKPDFLGRLLKRDSTLQLDSFYFIRLDTMTEKKAYTRQRFALQHLSDNIDSQYQQNLRAKMIPNAQTKAEHTDMLEKLGREKLYLGHELDSLRMLIQHADSVVPIGYRASYKVTVVKNAKFTISDTIAYSINLKMHVTDWDRNIEKNIDSLAIGRPEHEGGVH